MAMRIARPTAQIVGLGGPRVDFRRNNVARTSVPVTSRAKQHHSQHHNLFRVIRNFTSSSPQREHGDRLDADGGDGADFDSPYAAVEQWLMTNGASL